MLRKFCNSGLPSFEIQLKWYLDWVLNFYYVPRFFEIEMLRRSRQNPSGRFDCNREDAMTHIMKLDIAYY